MSIYNYTLPSGSKYQVTVPAGTTQAQADDIFYSQVAAGTFVGYEIGDTLINPTQALENFGITRLQRGTAGTAAAAPGAPEVILPNQTCCTSTKVFISLNKE